MQHLPSIRLLVLSLCMALLSAGCTYYGYPPGPPPPQATNYDRSFYAAADALRDQGVTIQVQDQATGNISGNFGSTPVSASIRQQADGSVRVAFTTGDSRNPGLIDRITQSYNRRMGR